MGVDDARLIDPSQVSDENRCTICLNALNPFDAVQTPCAHIFCRTCIVRALQRKRQCPEDRATVRIGELKDLRCVNLFACKVLGKLLVRCENFDAGCEWQGQLSNIQDHLKASCEYFPENCRLCSNPFPRRELENHEENMCEFRLATCEYCNDLMPIHELTSGHPQACLHYPVTCHLCAQVMSNSTLRSHLDHTCPQSIIECSYASKGCAATMMRKDLQQHLSENPALHLDLVSSAYEEQKRRMHQHERLVDDMHQRLLSLESLCQNLTEQLGSLRHPSGRNCVSGPFVDYVLSVIGSSDGITEGDLYAQCGSCRPDCPSFVGFRTILDKLEGESKIVTINHRLYCAE